MIKAMAAFDDKNGLATDAGIPWDLPSDREYVHRKIFGTPVLMGYRTYQERKGPRKDGQSFVVVRPGTKLQDGFIPVENLDSFLAGYKDTTETVWIMGGAKVYEHTLNQIQELYVTRVQGDFNCTKFFPRFEDQFTKVQERPKIEENGLKFHYEIWRRNS